MEGSGCIGLVRATGRSVEVSPDAGVGRGGDEQQGGQTAYGTKLEMCRAVETGAGALGCSLNWWAARVSNPAPWD
jgi:hypothetical protein